MFSSRGGGGGIFIIICEGKKATASFIIFSIFDLFSCVILVKIRTRRRVWSGANIWKSFFEWPQRMYPHSQVKSHGWCTNTSKVGLHIYKGHPLVYVPSFRYLKKEQKKRPSSQNEPPPIYVYIFTLKYFSEFFLKFSNESLTRNLVAFQVPPPLRPRGFKKIFEW